MNSITRSTIKHCILQMLLTLAICPAMIWAEAKWGSYETACMQAKPLALVSTAFVALTLIVAAIYRRLVEQRAKALVAFYMASKCITMLLALGVITVYALTGRNGLLPFTLNLMVVYLVFLVNTSWLYASTERNLKNK